MPYGLAVLDGGTWHRTGYQPPPDDPGNDPGPIPSRTSIIAGAGLTSDVEDLTPVSGLVNLTTPGQVYEGRDVAGAIFVRASNVTVRNCRVRGFWSSPGMRIDNGVTGTVIEHCEIEGLSNPDNAADGSNTMLGSTGGPTLTTVRYCELHGSGEPIKLDSGTDTDNPSVYEYNYIHPTIPDGDPLHLDGMQGGGKKWVRIRRNVIATSALTNANSCILIQGWVNPNNAQTEGVWIEENYLRGGNNTVFLIGGKSIPGAADPRYDAGNPGWYWTYIKDCTLTGNRFEGGVGVGQDNRYGYLSRNPYDGDGIVIAGNLVNGVPTEAL